jgi:hypothetical protein
MKRYIVWALLALCSLGASAGEYCVAQYNEKITKVNAELGGLLTRQDAIDTRIAEIFIKTGELSQQLAEAAGKVPPDVSTIARLGKEIGDLNREKVLLQAEGFKILDRVTQLKGTIPSGLQGELKGCLQATGPANKLVNLAIQALALLATGGLSVNLPPQALYVDFSAVLNGYPFGGDASVINEAREAALKALPFGMGSPGNDVRKVIVDPGRIIRCWFGC